MIRTLTIIGGGSAYTPGLVAALIHHRDALHLEEVRLYDIDQDNLETVSRLTASMARAAGASFVVRGVAELLEAVTGTDAVLNSSRPGGFDCRMIDETLPLEFAVPGQETVGPGGFFFALRSVPSALGLARVVVEHAPGAIFLNYTNPTNIVTQALSGGDLRVIGMCDQSDEDLLDLARAVGSEGPWTFGCTGLNHATWYADVRIGGETLPPIESIPTPQHLAGEYRLRFERSRDIAARHPGYWPNSYLAYYVDPEAFVEHALENGVRSAAIAKKLPSYFEHFREEAAKDVPNLQRHRGSEGFGDMAVRVLKALDGAQPEPIVLNLPNQRAAPLFREDTVVEVVCDVSAQKADRHEAPPMLSDQQPLLIEFERYQRAAAEAATSGDAKLAREALAANPLVPSREVADQMFEAAKGRYGARIPMFA